MKKLLIAGAALAMVAGSAMAQTSTTAPTSPAPSAAPTSADRTPGTVGSERECQLGKRLERGGWDLQRR